MDREKSLSGPVSGSWVDGDETTSRQRRDEGHSFPAVSSVPPCEPDQKGFQIVWGEWAISGNAHLLWIKALESEQQCEHQRGE